MSTRRNDSDVMQRILSTATEVFATEGFAGARVDVIAARAGVSKALIYYHVEDKESLYASVMLAMLESARSAILAAVKDCSGPEERLRCAIRAIAGLAAANPHFAPLMLREIATGGSGLPDKVVTEMRKVFGVMVDTLREGIEAGVFRPVDPVATHMLVAGGVLVLMSGTPIRRRVRSGDGGSNDPEAIPDYVASLLLDGLRQPAAIAAPRRPARRK